MLSESNKRVLVNTVRQLVMRGASRLLKERSIDELLKGIIFESHEADELFHFFHYGKWTAREVELTRLQMRVETMNLIANKEEAGTFLQQQIETLAHD